MNTAEFKPLLDIVNSGGIVALLLVLLLGGSRRWWVFGWQYQMMIEDRDRWRDVALHGSNLAEKAVDTLSRR